MYYRGGKAKGSKAEGRRNKSFYLLTNVCNLDASQLIKSIQNQQPQAQTDEDADSQEDESLGSGMGARVAGAAVGGILGARSGGVIGAVAGAVAGAMIGKGTADTVNRAVDNLGDAAHTVAEGVKETGVKEFRGRQAP